MLIRPQRERPALTQEHPDSNSDHAQFDEPVQSVSSGELILK